MENRDRRKINRGEGFSKKHFTTPKPDNKEMVFGIRAVIETIKAGQEIDKLLMQRELGSSPLMAELVQVAHAHNVPVSKVPLEKLDRITRKNHQGAICFISAIRYVSLHNILSEVFEKGQTPLLLLLDRITDVRNFGAIARTAECAGVHALIIPSKGAAQINADAIKTSSGALNFLPVCREENLRDTLQYLQQSGLQVVACTEKADKSIYEVDLAGPTAIIMGSEEDGISQDLIRKADQLAKIPMIGNIASLNVSVATGVVVYEVIRQRT
ncbi:23S rRNA (guanosine(2251)-2'-O)-methyltransferase RlmB [Rhodocytophaga aerolata]|uniref:23S rRNA (Guanosine(2251)-2'-O)-methyltransferase RlmB n=1 Tax=Rhodocytophaga aerolata TaxID=455078 RepID=A0ABT8R6C8_9BACT|nr:23S rRNA (guanosine(2251)-2'-O)-methyltransferase RlmB [Rhodocytophaga aerolata]MDO1446307.1 23S rRNA (guanosine(2251)-2'-O)-methyltransferase RlmB [Rhodocytophaga aerolata]